VSVIVSVLELAGVDMRVVVGLSVVAVLVRMLHMIMIMCQVCVGVHHILMGVLMSVRRGHPVPFFCSLRFGEASPYPNRFVPRYRRYTPGSTFARQSKSHY
jgi:hypothetical protein